jgi:DNA-binding transcriptional ArsR family regulator
VPDRSETLNVNSSVHGAGIDRGRLELHPDWLERAARLPGKAMHLAVALLRIAAAEQVHRVSLSNLFCERFGLNRNAKYRALRSLEDAGLVAVERKLGQSPIVTILDSGGAL